MSIQLLTDVTLFRKEPKKRCYSVTYIEGHRPTSKLCRDCHCYIVDPVRNCNCRSPKACPLKGSCLTSSVVYRATVKMENVIVKFYIGSSVAFKSRYRTHMSTFYNAKCSNSTTLASYIHKLKQEKMTYSVEWGLMTRRPGFIMNTRSRRLYIFDSLMIFKYFNARILNTFTEAIHFCCHKYSAMFLKFYKYKFNCKE